MALTEQDREWIQMTARELCREVIEVVMVEHIKTCPHGKSILIGKWLAIGMLVGSGVAGGASGCIFVKLILGL